MMEVSAIVLSGTQNPNSAQQQPNLTEAASQFEALLIGGMLKSARESDTEGCLGAGGDGANETALSMAEEQLAQAMSARGGLGLAKIIVEQMSRSQSIGESQPSFVAVHNS